MSGVVSVCLFGRNDGGGGGELEVEMVMEGGREKPFW